jgi:hypothetical protein
MDKEHFVIKSITEYMALLESDDIYVRGQVIDEEVSENVLMHLIDNYPDLKVLVIRNKAVPERVLTSLVDDQDVRVRRAVAKKRKLPMLHLEKLAHDADDGVRREVAHHTKITKHILEILTQDEEGDIAERAKRRLEEQDYKVNT